MRRINGITKGMIILAGVLFFGCATSRDVQVLDRDIDKSYSEIKVLKKENDTFKNELSIIKNEMAGLKSDLSMENQRVKADLLLQIKNLQTEIRSLSTGVEEYKEFSKRPSKEVDRMKGDLEGRIRILEERGRTSEEKNKYQEGKNKELEEQNKFQEGKIKELEDHLRELAGKMDKLASKQAEIEKPPPSKEILSEIKGVSAGAGDLYKDAYETFQKGDLEGARRKFETFLKQYPNTELSDNTQFWIGETFYLKKDYEKAILEYEKAIVKYPEGDKIPSALFKQALAFLELGDKTNARNLFRRVIERYPQSDQAEMAKKRLDAIK